MERSYFSWCNFCDEFAPWLLPARDALQSHPCAPSRTHFHDEVRRPVWGPAKQVNSQVFSYTDCKQIKDFLSHSSKGAPACVTDRRTQETNSRSKSSKLIVLETVSRNNRSLRTLSKDLLWHEEFLATLFRCLLQSLSSPRAHVRGYIPGFASRKCSYINFFNLKFWTHFEQ